MWLMKTLLTSGCVNQRGAGHVNGEDYLGMLKIICLNFMEKLDVANIGMRELTYIEMFAGPLFRKVFPELCPK